MLKPCRTLAVCLLGLAAAASPAAAREELVSIAGRPGVSLSMLVIAPDAPPEAVAALYVGGAGSLSLKPDRPPGQRGGNFLFRTADMLVQAGIAAIVLDAPSDSPRALWNLRTRPDHARDAQAVIAWARARFKAPVWVVGTSMGSLSAANAAARLEAPEGPDGVILTSSVTETSRNTAETTLSVDLAAIRIPLLVVNHQGDGCAASPPSGAERILNEATNAPIKALLSMTGGKPAESGECEPFAAHGYFGIEAETVAAMAAWIKRPVGQ